METNYFSMESYEIVTLVLVTVLSFYLFFRGSQYFPRYIRPAELLIPVVLAIVLVVMLFLYPQLLDSLVFVVSICVFIVAMAVFVLRYYRRSKAESEFIKSTKVMSKQLFKHIKRQGILSPEGMKLLEAVKNGPVFGPLDDGIEELEAKWERDRKELEAIDDPEKLLAKSYVNNYDPSDTLRRARALVEEKMRFSGEKAEAYANVLASMANIKGLTEKANKHTVKYLELTKKFLKNPLSVNLWSIEAALQDMDWLDGTKGNEREIMNHFRKIRRNATGREW